MINTVIIKKTLERYGVISENKDKNIIFNKNIRVAREAAMEMPLIDNKSSLEFR